MMKNNKFFSFNPSILKRLVFNYSFLKHLSLKDSWIKVFSILVIFLGSLSIFLPSSSVQAQEVFFTPRSILADFFQQSQKVTFLKFAISPEQHSRIQQKLGYSLPKLNYTFYVAKTEEQIDGYALIDEELGQHLPITFAIKFSPQGAVQRQEIMVYRERYGDEVKDPRFRQQFVGKTASDPLRAGEEITAISGATISSRSMTIGVRRALVLLDELILKTK